MKLEEKLLEQYFDVIEKNGNTENQIQEFLEENTIFIPMPFLLNHYLHMNCVISKFKLGNEFVTDFAYLTKSSDYWEFVLVELEDAKKKIFTNDKENIYFHSEFNHAYDQITSWKAFFLDRVSLSIKNGWIDNQGRVFIYYSIKKFARI